MALRRNGDGAIVSLQTGFHALDFRGGEACGSLIPEADITVYTPE